MKTMIIEDAMTPCPYKIEASCSIDEAVSKMALHGIRHLPVVEGSNLIGSVSERDLILSQIVCKSSNYCPTVGELCASAPLVVLSTDSIAKVAGSMADSKSDFALIAKDEELVGIFTTVDACRALQRILET